MADLMDKYGKVVYRMDGDRIIDIYGNKKFEIRGEYIFDTYGNRKFEIRGEWLYDTYGNRLGEMKNLVEYLDPPGDSSSSSSTRHFPKTEESSGCLGYIFAIIVFLLFSNWGGRIGVILGFVFTVLALVTGSAADPLNAIFMGVFAMILLGGVGALIGAIVNGIKKLANKNK